MQNNILFLRTLLEANQYSHDRLMAAFFDRHKDKIFSLLPGVKSNDFEARMKEYEEIERLCITILT